MLVTVLILTTAGGGPGDRFERIILIATSISLIPYGLTAIALLRLLRTDRAAFGACALVGYGVIAVLASAYSIRAVVGSGLTVIRQGAVLLAAGGPVYLWLTRRRPRSGRADGPMGTEG